MYAAGVLFCALPLYTSPRLERIRFRRAPDNFQMIIFDTEVRHLRSTTRSVSQVGLKESHVYL